MPASVLGGSSAACTEASPRPITNFVWPSESRPTAMSSATGRPLSLAATAASVPGIDVGVTVPPALRSARRALTRPRARAPGSLEVITTAPFSSSRLAPLANIPAEPIQLREVLPAPAALSAPSSPSGMSRPCNSPPRLSPLGAFRARASERAGQRGEALEALDILTERSCRGVPGRSPATIRRAVPPSACALSGSVASRPALPAPEAEARVSASTVSDPPATGRAVRRARGARPSVRPREPASSASRLRCLRADACGEAGVAYTCAIASAGAAARSFE